MDSRACSALRLRCAYSRSLNDSAGMTPSARIAASVRRSSAHAARLSRRSVYKSAAPAEASAIAVVTSMTTMSLPATLRRALPMDSNDRHGRRSVLKTLLSIDGMPAHLAFISEIRSTAISFVLQEQIKGHGSAAGALGPYAVNAGSRDVDVRFRGHQRVVRFARTRRAVFGRRGQGGLSVPFRAVRRVACRRQRPTHHSSSPSVAPKKLPCTSSACCLA